MKFLSVLTLASMLGFGCSASLAQDMTYSSYSGKPDASILQNQVNIHATVPDTYYSLIANNWGYGGLQMNSDTTARTVLFSIWDWNNEESTIYAYNANASIVKNGRFGGEGTGVQFLFNYPWKYDRNYRLAYRIFPEPDHVHARFSGFYYDSAVGAWKYVVTERANTAGTGVFEGGNFYSFAESYGNVSGLRDATMNNAWSYLPASGWTEYDSGVEFNNSQEGIAYASVLTSDAGFEFYSCLTCTPMAENTSVSYTPPSETPIVIPFHISAGNTSAVGDWEPDSYYQDNAGDSEMVSLPAKVGTSLIGDRSHQAVYQTLRSGSDFQYNLFGFLPESNYVVTLQFVEPSSHEIGRRVEDVTINDVPVLSRFDIRRVVGAPGHAISTKFRVKSDSKGKITVHFTKAEGSTLPAVVSTLSTATVNEDAITAQLGPESLTFATETVGQTSAAQNVTLRNTGDSPLTIGNIFVTTGFSQTNNCGASLAPRRSCAIAVTFTPYVNGTQNGTLVVQDNAANGVQDTVSLIGTGTGGTGVANGTYTISNSASGLLLDDPGSSTAAGNNVDVYPATGNPNQEWIFTALGGGYYEIVNVASGLALNDPASSKAAGTLLIQYPYQSTSNEAWLMTQSGSGFILTSEVSGLVVDPAANTAGVDIQQAAPTGAASQVWSVQPIQ